MRSSVAACAILFSAAGLDQPAEYFTRIRLLLFMKDRFKVIPAAYLLMVKEGEILLLRRFQTAYYDGCYSLPAGHVEENETCTDSIVREAHEEVGITLKKEDLRFAHILYRMHGIPAPYGRLDIFFTADKWVGEPKNMEPEKCDDIQWFPLGRLPENMVPEVRQAIESFQKGIFYSEL